MRASRLALVVRKPPADEETQGRGSASGSGDPLPLQYSCLEKLTDRGAWGCIMSQESDRTEMTLNACTHFENVKK